ncbi:methyltransferase domain-containing protein [Actinomadura kijaniata]|uniref:methyltransferase domain-containing protein n=1 Tax=Actinomadura kijaniata TaxID=46161 RepID=UPI003F1BB5E2
MSAVADFAPEWLALREPADAEARAGALLPPLLDRLAGVDRPVVRDLGCGTGSMVRWLAGRLPGPVRWVLHDRDPRLLALAAADLAADLGEVETRVGDLAGLGAAELEGTALVVASALLDLFTFEELDALAAACVEAGCPALFALSVTGRVELDPPDPRDGEYEAAFNAHQRRNGLLGPDAVAAAEEAFARRGARVLRAASPWRLDGRPALTAEWLRGWVGAAVEQRPDLADLGYLRRRLDACAAGELRAVVHHADLLALPGEGR